MASVRAVKARKVPRHWAKRSGPAGEPVQARTLLASTVGPWGVASNPLRCEIRAAPLAVQDLSKFNQFFMEREEDAVIQLQALQDGLAAAATPAAQAQARARLVDFHGSCVLLLHWGLLNYAAVAKILKKHDKRTGVLLRAPYLANVLQQVRRWRRLSGEGAEGVWWPCHALGSAMRQTRHAMLGAARSATRRQVTSPHQRGLPRASAHTARALE